MPLQLMPTYDDTTRQRYEEFLQEVRSRRLSAALEYRAGQELKLDREMDDLQNKLSNEYERLCKNLERMESLDTKVQEQMIKIESYLQELGFAAVVKETASFPQPKKRGKRK